MMQPPYIIPLLWQSRRLLPMWRHRLQDSATDTNSTFLYCHGLECRPRRQHSAVVLSSPDVLGHVEKRRRLIRLAHWLFEIPYYSNQKE